MDRAMPVSDRIGRRMKLQDLHVLMTVVQAGGMGKAAERLHLTQPAVSRSIAALEKALGVRLLDRRRQGVEATEYGRALIDGGAAMFDDLRQAVQNIEFLADPTTGSVRIGCSQFLTTTLVSAVVDQLSQRYPSIVFDIAAANEEMLRRELIDRNVDFLIARKLGRIADDRLEFEMLYDDSFGIVTGVKNPLVRRRQVELIDLMNEAWVLPRPATVPGSIFAQAFQTIGHNYPRTTIFTEHQELRVNLLASGRFLSIFSASILRFHAKRAELRVLPVDLALARVPVGIVTLRNRTLSPVAKLFIEHARKIAKPLAKRK